MNVLEQIQQVNAQRSNSILKAFGIELEKARSGIYTNTYENRKLGRVGRKYGNKKEENKSNNIYNLKNKYESADFKYNHEYNNFIKENKLVPGVVAKIKFRDSELGKKLEKEKYNSYKELMDKVDDSKNKKKLTFYNVILSSDTNTEELYSGYDKKEAESIAKNVDSSDNSSKYSNSAVIIQKREDEYVFAGNAKDNETEEDYPLEDESSREDKWVKTSKEDEFEIIDDFTVEGSEKNAEDLRNDVFDYFNKEYGRDKYSSYDSINLGEDKDGNTIDLQIRIKNHSENPRNKGVYTSADNYLSIVVANKDETAERFHSSTELYFTGDDNLDDIKEQVFNYIQDIIDNSEIVKLDKKLISASHKLE